MSRAVAYGIGPVRVCDCRNVIEDVGGGKCQACDADLCDRCETCGECGEPKPKEVR